MLNEAQKNGTAPLATGNMAGLREMLKFAGFKKVRNKDLFRAEGETVKVVSHADGFAAFVVV